MAGVHTSVPRWPTTDPGVDTSGRSFGVVAVGQTARGVAEGWVDEIRGLCRPVDHSFHAHPPLDEWLARARVGYRLMLAGPQADLLRLRARAAVLLDAELTLLVTDDRERPVWCVHCGTTTRAEAEVDGRAACAGCARELVVHHHVSRAHGSYLGYWSGA